MTGEASVNGSSRGPRAPGYEVARSDHADFIAVDLGASSGRAVLGQLDGERWTLRELRRFPNGPVRVAGALHWNVLGLWAELQGALTAHAREGRAPVCGIGVDTWGVDFGLLDRRDNLLGAPYHYRDARTDGQMERVFEALPKEALYARTGLQFMQINTLYQLYSMRGDPQLEAAETLLMMPDLFHFWLSGEKCGEYTAASTSQLLDARARAWAPDLLDVLGLPSRILPPLVPPGTVLGTLRGSVASETRLPASTPVIAPAGHDTASAVAATAGLEEGAFISSGTWSLVGAEVAEPVLTERARELDFTNEGGVGGSIRLLKNVAGLWLVEECKRQWGREGSSLSWPELLAAAAAAPPFRSFVDAGAETFLNPGDMPEAIRTFCRRSGQPVPEGIGETVRCCLESLALKYRTVLDDLEALTGRRFSAVRVVGGGSQNGLLNQFTADACARPVIAGPVEATALGNLTVQAVARGLLPDIGAGRKVVAASADLRTFGPKHVDAWEAALARFQALVGEKG